MKKVGIYTLGCKVNQYESEAIAERFEEKGISPASPDTVCDAYVINTCTVTAESDRKARQFIRRAIKKNPHAFILVTGCMAQSRSEMAKAICGVDYICGSSNKLSVVDKALQLFERGEKNESPEVCIPDLDTAPFECMNIKRFERTRAYLKIEDGCENRCSYCAIPAARGPVRSRPMEDVLLEVRRLTENGCREIVLTGIETASYGKDTKKADLADLLLQIDLIENVGRIRIGSIDPSVMRPEFVDKLARVKCLTPHFHISMQSGSNRILALMKRKYNRDMALKNIEYLKSKIDEVMLTTDFIVGFPGESDEDFDNTVDIARKMEFLDMHVFPYSKRSGTSAAEMDGQLPEQTKKERAAKLIAVGKELTKKALAEFAKRNEFTTVLFETFEDGFALGHTDSFVPVKAKSERSRNAELLRVRIEKSDDSVCIGTIIEE